MSEAMAAIDLEAEYNNRARVPEHPAIIAGWYRDAEAYRAARGASVREIAYGPHPRQRIDVIAPERPAEAAAVVAFLHGGYWQALDHRAFSHLAAGANAHGLTVAMIGYRLCPEVSLATIVEDVREACRVLDRTLARPLVACGHSAGGHLAAVLAATDWRGRVGGGRPDLLRRGLAISGLFALEPLLATSVNRAVGLDAATARCFSPALWEPPAGVRLEAWVGGAESAEYQRQSRDFTAIWEAQGAATRFATVPGANHFTIVAELTDPQSPMTRALAALAKG